MRVYITGEGLGDGSIRLTYFKDDALRLDYEDVVNCVDNYAEIAEFDPNFLEVPYFKHFYTHINLLEFVKKNKENLTIYLDLYDRLIQKYSYILEDCTVENLFHGDYVILTSEKLSRYDIVDKRTIETYLQVNVPYKVYGIFIKSNQVFLEDFPNITFNISNFKKIVQNENNL